MTFRFLNWFGQRAKPRAPLDVLEAGLEVEPSGRDLTQLLPIILPLELLNLGWPGPIVRIGELPFCAAWATCGDMNTFFYVTDQEARYWEEEGIDWQAMALSNLSKLSASQPASGQKLDDDGLPFVKVMLHGDALGPSRLLVPHLFDDVLGTGYEVAIPERTCAIAYRKALAPDQSADVNAMIVGCFEHGTEPMSPERFEAHLFWGFAERGTER